MSSSDTNKEKKGQLQHGFTLKIKVLEAQLREKNNEIQALQSELTSMSALSRKQTDAREDVMKEVRTQKPHVET